MSKRRNVILATLVLMCGLMLTAATPAHAAKKKSVYVLSEMETKNRVDVNETTKYSYNKNGLLKKRSVSLGTYNYTYKGKKITKSKFTADDDAYPSDITTKNTYNKKGFLKKTVRTMQDYKETIKYSYDKKNRLKKKTSITKASGVTLHAVTTYSYNSKNRVKKMVFTDLDRDDKNVYEYKYDKHGNVIKETWTRYLYGNKGASDYSTYDNLYEDGRLISRTGRDADTEVYEYSYVYFYKYKKIKVPKKYVKAVKKQQKDLLPNGYLDIDE